MTTKDEALDLALEAMEKLRTPLRVNTSLDAYDVGRAITAIKQARSAPAQEPLAIPHEWRKVLRKLAFMARTSGGTVGHDSGLSAACEEAEALLSKPYATPPAAQRQWVGLTTDDVWGSNEVMALNAEMGLTIVQIMTLMAWANAKLKEKNT